MWRARRLAGVTLLALFAALAAFSAVQLTITVDVTTVKEDGPVQVVGLKLPDKPLGAPRVVIRNTTAKEVRQTQLQYFEGNPEVVDDTNAKSVLAPGPDSLWASQEHVIAPNGDAEFRTDNFKPVILAGISSQHLDSNCLHVVVFIGKVEFSDGTVWEVDPKQAQTFWEDSIRPESLGSCDNSPKAQEMLKQVNWFAVSGAPPPRSSSETVQFFSATCTVSKREGRLIAVCDW